VATSGFKRRTASRQAVSRKVEGIEPRKRRAVKDDAVFGAEVNMDEVAKIQNLPQSHREHRGMPLILKRFFSVTSVSLW